MLRTVLLHRVTLFLAAVLLVVAALNIYVSLENDGILAGRIVGPEGAPLEGAEVTLYRPGIVGIDKVATTATDAAGGFRFEGHGHHHPALIARAPGYAESGLRRVRLYFRNQNRTLAEPIRLAREGE